MKPFLGLNPLLHSLRSAIVQTYDSLNNTWSETTIYYWDIAVKVHNGLFN